MGKATVSVLYWRDTQTAALLPCPTAAMADFNWGGAEQAEGNAIANSQAANGQWKANDATNQTDCPKFSGVKPHDLTAASVLPASATLKQAKITHPAYYSSVTVSQSNGKKQTFGPFRN